MIWCNLASSSLLPNPKWFSLLLLNWTTFAEHDCVWYDWECLLLITLLLFLLLTEFGVMMVAADVVFLVGVGCATGVATCLNQEINSQTSV